MAHKVGGVYAEVRMRDDKLKRDLDQAHRKIDRMATKSQKSLSRINFTALGVAATGAAIAAGYALQRIGREAINAASNLQEVQSKFDTVFAGQTATAESWATTLVDSYAMSTREAKEYLSSVQDLLVPMGMQADSAAQLSNEIVRLSADLGSFNNQPTARVMQDIQSALVGNYETMKKYGVVLTATRVQQTALNMGLAKTKAELTTAQKAQVAYKLIVEGSQAAIGDMGRTMDEYANTQKRYEAAWENLSATLGKRFLPVATKVKEILADIYNAANRMLTDDPLNKQIEQQIENMQRLKELADMTAVERRVTRQQERNEYEQRSNPVTGESAQVKADFEAANKRLMELSDALDNLGKTTAAQRAVEKAQLELLYLYDLKRFKVQEDHAKKMAALIGFGVSDVGGLLGGGDKKKIDLTYGPPIEARADRSSIEARATWAQLEKKSDAVYRKYRLNQEFIQRDIAAGKAMGADMWLSYAEGAEDAAVRAERAIENQFTTSKRMAEDFSYYATSAMSDGFFYPIIGEMDRLEDVWTNLWQSMLRTVTDIAAEMVIEFAKKTAGKFLVDVAVSGSGSSSGGAVSGFLNKIPVVGPVLGGIAGAFGLAEGGPAYKGQSYIVGERGPELFVPKNDGQIMPNNHADTVAALASGSVSGFNMPNFAGSTAGLDMGWSDFGKWAGILSGIAMLGVVPGVLGAKYTGNIGAYLGDMLGDALGLRHDEEYRDALEKVMTRTEGMNAYRAQKYAEKMTGGQTGGYGGGEGGGGYGPGVGGVGQSAGYRARGGDVFRGKQYWVGEEGRRELFTPKEDGTITPESKIGGGDTHIHIGMVTTDDLDRWIAKRNENAQRFGVGPQFEQTDVTIVGIDT